MKDYRKTERRFWLWQITASIIALLAGTFFPPSTISYTIGAIFGGMFGLSVISYISVKWLPLHRHKVTNPLFRWYVKEHTVYQSVADCKKCKRGEEILWSSWQ